MTSTAEPTLLDARTHYFEANGFGDDGGYSKPTVTIEIGPLRFALPNTPARVRAVRYHDLHHVLTGYRTDMRGEAEISAWELASGCKREYAAWLLNMGAMMYGLLFHPGAMVRAWTRGRQSDNLYGRDFDDELLGRHVCEMRDELGLAKSARMRWNDGLTFGVAALLLLPLVPIAAMLATVVALTMWIIYRQ